MKFGDFYHILHHVHEVLEIAKVKLKDERWTVKEDVAFRVALNMAIDERLKEMTPYEKQLAIRQASVFEEPQVALLERALSIPVQGTNPPRSMADLVDELVRYYLLFYSYLMEGKTPPWEPA